MSSYSDYAPGPTLYWPAGTSARWRLALRQCRTCPALDLTDAQEVEFIFKRTPTTPDASALFTKKLSTGGIVAVDLALGLVDVVIDDSDTSPADGYSDWIWLTRVTLEDGTKLQPFGVSGGARMDALAPSVEGILAADSTTGTIAPVALTSAPLPAYATVAYVDAGLAGKQPLDADLTAYANAADAAARRALLGSGATGDAVFTAATPAAARAATQTISSSQTRSASTLPASVPAAQVQDSPAQLSPVTLTEAEFEALNEYEPRIYDVIGVGRYFGPKVLMRAPWSYSPGDLHVTKAGNDTTGNGSFAAPFLTIYKAFTTALTAGGGKIWVDEGTYAETDGVNGYFFRSTAAPASPIIISGRPDKKVVLTNVSNTRVIGFIGATANISFRNLEIKAADSTATAFYECAGTSGLTNCELVECVFNDDQTTALSLNVVGTLGTTGFAVKRCTFLSDANFGTFLRNLNGLRFIGNSYVCPSANDSFIGPRIDTGSSGTFYVSSNYIRAANASFVGALSQSAAFAGAATMYCRGNYVEVGGNGSGNADVGIYLAGGSLSNKAVYFIERNTIIAGGRGIILAAHADGGRVADNRVTSGGSVTLGWPTENAIAEVVSNTVIENNRLIASGGTANHTFLCGTGSAGLIVRNNYIDGRLGAYGLVLKGATHIVSGNVVFGGSQNSILLKGSNSVTLQNNSFTQSVSSVNGTLAFETGILSEPQVSCLVSGNTFYVSASSLYDFTAIDLGTGNVIDNNYYKLSGAAVWGSMFGASVSSLSAVRASWASNYPSGAANDAESSDV